MLFTFSTSANQVNLVPKDTFGDEDYREMVVDGDELYVATDGIIILDISNSAEPIEITKIPIGVDNYVRNIFKVDNYLYAMTFDSLFIFDVSDLDTPVKVSSLPRENKSFWRNFVVKNDYLFIVGAGNETNVEDTFLFVYSLENKASPSLLEKIDLPDNVMGDVRLALTPSHLMALVPDGIKLFSLAENDFLKEVYNNNQEITFYPDEIQVLGNVAYIANGNLIVAYDFSDISNVIKTETIASEKNVQEMCLAGSKLHLADYDGYISTFDISILTSPSFINRSADKRGNGFILSCEAYKDKIILNDRKSIFALNNLVEISQFHKVGTIHDITISGDILVAASNPTVIFSIEKGKLNKVAIQSQYSTSVESFNEYLYTSRGDAFDFSDIDNVFQTSGFGGNGSNYIVYEDKLMGVYQQFLTNYSLEIPSTPSFIESFNMDSLYESSTQVNSFARKEESYFIGTSEGLYHFYKNEEGELTTLGKISENVWVRSVLVDGDYLYAAFTNSYVSIWDIKEPLNAKLLSSTYVSGFNIEDLTVYKSWLFVPTSYSGIQILDISNPRFPVYVGNDLLGKDGIRGIEVFNNSLLAHTAEQLHLFIINEAPKILTELLSTEEDSNLVTTLDIINLENDSLEYHVTEKLNGGTLSIDEGGELTYQPNGNFNGEDSFTLKVIDEYGGNDERKITITVDSINDSPIVQNNDFSVVGGNVLIGNLLATDIENDSLTYLLELEPTSGNVVISEDGSFEYTPNTSFTGIDSFIFVVYDDPNVLTQGVASITVAPPSISSDSDGGSFSWLSLLLLFGVRGYRANQI